MGRFDPKYTPEQREAVVSAIVDGGKKPREAVADAAAGKYDGLGPYEMPLSTAQTLASDERRKRRGEDFKRRATGTPTERLEAASERLLMTFEAHVETFEKRSRRTARQKKAPDPAELDRLKKLATFGREVGALVRGVPASKAGAHAMAEAAAAKRAAATDPEVPSPDDDLVARMQRDSGFETPLGKRGRRPQENGDTP